MPEASDVAAPAGTGVPAPPGRSRADLRDARARAAAERRRRRQRRLLPLLAAVAVVVLVAVVALAPEGRRAPRGGGSSAPVRSTTTTTAPPYLPPPVTSAISPAQPGEGQWAPQDVWAPSPPSVMTTTFRTDPADPTITAYAAWMRTSSTVLGLYPGYKGPGPTAAGVDRGPEQVPDAGRPYLLSAFNSGFYEADAAGGFYAHGITYFPMVPGLATVVTRTDGSAAIEAWTGGPTPDASVVMARQNLPLLVDHGAPTAATAVPATWGVTLYGAPRVWRTALGIDAHGNLIYVAAPLQTAASLAQVMVQVGAVRAMQLDINPEWPIYVLYGGPGAASPSLFVPNPNQIPGRFLYSSTKDFFALFQRLPTLTVPPW